MTAQIPTLIHGGMFADERGVLRFANDFTFVGVKRFYHVVNALPRFVRAWQGHEKEGKYVYVATGAALVAAVKMGSQLPQDDRIGPITHSKSDEPPMKFLLSAEKPAVLWIPPGYANGWMNLEPASNLFFFSTATLEESKADDFRFPANHWDIWDDAG